MMRRALLVLLASTALVGAQELRVDVQGNTLQIHGGTFNPSPLMKPVPGPLSGLDGFTAQAPVDLALETPVGTRGSVMFWFRPDHAYRAGASVKPETIPLVHLGTTAQISFE